jgi:hypothetical protein
MGYPYVQTSGGEIGWCLGDLKYLGCVSTLTPCAPYEGGLCDPALGDDTIADVYVEQTCIPAMFTPCDPPADSITKCE